MTISELRQVCRRIWEAALRSADPASCIRQNVSFTPGNLIVAGQTIPLNGKLVVVGTGKASGPMAKAVEEILGPAISGGIVVTKYGHRSPLERIEIVEAGHPIPDKAGEDGVERVRRRVSGLSPDDVVLCLISGGGSALWPSPAEGITLHEKQETTSQMLRAGASILQLNAVRKHLSKIKGGQLARWAVPARVVSLIMSDIVGDPLDFIASGPTAPDTSTFEDALKAIDDCGVQVSRAVLSRLEAGARGEVPETPKPGDPIFDNVRNEIIANNRLLVETARRTAQGLGFRTLILTRGLEGEACEAGRFFAAIGREIAQNGDPIPSPACVLAAGETTVAVHGKGSGGRNQEMALAWAAAMAERKMAAACCFASIASDGTDGPTDAAGGLVDPLTGLRGRQAGLDAARYLRDNDSFHFLSATGDLVKTGPTGTNLMDLQILLVDGAG